MKEYIRIWEKPKKKSHMKKTNFIKNFTKFRKILKKTEKELERWTILKLVLGEVVHVENKHNLNGLTLNWRGKHQNNENKDKKSIKKYNII